VIEEDMHERRGEGGRRRRGRRRRRRRKVITIQEAGSAVRTIMRSLNKLKDEIATEEQSYNNHHFSFGSVLLDCLSATFLRTFRHNNFDLWRIV
jgi:hypothetical protein